jgi:hypothetical protein
VPPLYLSIRRQICPGPLNYQFSKLSGFRDDVALAKFPRLGSCLKIVMVITKCKCFVSALCIDGVEASFLDLI